MRKLRYSSELANDKVFMMGVRDSAKALADKQFSVNQQYEDILIRLSKLMQENLDSFLDKRGSRFDKHREALAQFDDSIEEFNGAIVRVERLLSEMKLMKRYGLVLLRELDMELLEATADEVDFYRDQAKGMAKSLSHLIQKGWEGVARTEAKIVDMSKLIAEQDKGVGA